MRDETSLEWQRKQHFKGVFTRKTENVDTGKTVAEKYNSFFKIKWITDSYSDGSRRRLVYKQDFDFHDPTTETIQDGEAESTRDMYFFDAQQKFLTRVGIPNSKAITVDLKPSEISEDLVLERDAMIDLVYPNGRLSKVRIEIESADNMSTYHEEMNLPWQDKFQNALNYARNAEDSQLQDVRAGNQTRLSWEIQDIEESIINGSISSKAVSQFIQLDKLNPLIARLWQEISDTFPPDQKQEAQGLFLNLKYNELLLTELLNIARILNLYDIKALMEKYGRDKFLSECAEKALDDLIFQSRFAKNREIIELKGFTKENFTARSVGEEDDEEKAKPRRIIHQETTLPYGQEVIVYNKKFIVIKDGNMVKVTTFSHPKGKELWAAEFPLSISDAEIRDIYNDPNADFRQIKDKLAITVRKTA